jgi:hypothetical protein
VKEKKVYCKDCVYLKYTGGGFTWYNYKCLESKNIGNTWHGYVDNDKGLVHPRELNKNNNCKDYKRKWWLI